MSKLPYTLAMMAASGVGVVATQADAYTQTLNISSPDFSTHTSQFGAVDLTPITLASKGDPQFYYASFYGPCALSSGTCTGNGSNYVGFDFVLSAQLVSSITDFGTDKNGDVIANPYYGTPYGLSAVSETKSLTPGLPSVTETFDKGAAIGGIYADPKTVTIDTQDYDISNQNGFAFKLNNAFGQSDYYFHTIFDPAGTTYRGTFHVTADGGISTVTYAPIPEPDAWALLIAGVAGVGGVARARRRPALKAAA